MSEELSRKEIQALAAEVAESIVRNPAMRELLTGQLGVGGGLSAEEALLFPGIRLFIAFHLPEGLPLPKRI